MTNKSLSLTDPQDVRSWLAKTNPKQLSQLDKFETELRLDRLSTSSTATTRPASKVCKRRLVTTRTLELLRFIIGSTPWNDASQLMTLLRGLGQQLQAVGGFREPAIGNVVRRVMCAVRNEMYTIVAAEEKDFNTDGTQNGDSVENSSNTGGLSLANMLWAHPQHVIRNFRASESHKTETLSPKDADSIISFPPSFYVHRKHFRQAVMEAIHEIASDFEDMHKNIDDQATSHIHAGEVILIYARSRTVESFLKAAAAKKRKFQVIVCESAPHYGGHTMAKNLANSGIKTTVIHDAAIFAIMARVNKVLLSSHAVLANGGLISNSGTNMVALAAAENSVPVVSVTGMFKLCPMYPHDGQDTLQDLASPSSIINLTEMCIPHITNVNLINPMRDYIPPNLINMYVTNVGAFPPSYVYRLLAEYYHIDDWEAFE